MDLVQERGQVALRGLGSLHLEAGVHLCEQPGPPDHLGEELPHGPPGLASKRGQLGPELLQAGPALLRQVLHLIQVLQRLRPQEWRHVVPVLATERIVLVLAPRGHPGQVLEPHPVARAKEDAGQADAGERIGHRPGVGQDLHDLGELEQAGQPDDLDRYPLLGEGLLERNEQPAGPAQDGELRPSRFRPRVVELTDPAGDPSSLGPLVGEPADLHLAVAVGRPRRQLLVRVGALVRGDRLDDPVGRGEDARPGPEVRVQGELLGRTPVGPPELLLELQEVVEAGPPPPVDALVRVAYRRHGEARAEQPVDERGLGHVGVLVLVQDDREVARPVLLGDLWKALHHPEGQRDLVAEVDDAELPFQLLEAVHGRGELDPLQRRLVGPLAALPRQLTEPLPVELDDPPGLDPMIGGLVGQLEDLADQRGLPLRAGVLEGHLVEDPGTQLDPLGRGEHPLPRLDPGEKAVALEDLGGEPMVVGDGRFLPRREVQPREGPANAQHEVLGGLVRERQAQHVPRKDAPVIRRLPPQCHEREVDDAGGDHRGLPRAGAGNDHVRLERHRDGPPLLRRGVRPADHLADLLRVQVRGRHGLPGAHRRAPCTAGKSSRPSGHNGQIVLKSQ